MPTALVATDVGLLDGDVTRFPGRDVCAIALDDDGAVWSVIDDELWRGSELVARIDAECLCLAVDRDVAFIGTGHATVVRVTPNWQMATSALDAVSTRPEWHAVGTPIHVRSIAASGGAVYASVHVGGIVAGDVSGSEWHATGFRVDDDVHEVAVGGRGHLAAATALGLALSSDDGATWTFEWEGLPACYSRAVATDRSTGDVVMSVSVGPWADEGTVWMRGPNGGFRQVGEAMEGNVDTGCLALAAGKVAYAAADRAWVDGASLALPGRARAVLFR